MDIVKVIFGVNLRGLGGFFMLFIYFWNLKYSSMER